MIRDKHAKADIRKAKDLVKEAKLDGDLKAVLTAIINLVTVAIKVGLNNRFNNVKIMKKLGIPLEEAHKDELREKQGGE